jgi:hypothetical protein
MQPQDAQPAGERVRERRDQQHIRRAREQKAASYTTKLVARTRSSTPTPHGFEVT